MDVLATMTAEEYRKVKAQLTSEGLWHRGDGSPEIEERANRRTEEYLVRDLRGKW